ncbi:MAG: DUF839 domain-containing protein [Verrucomicrobiae bacterium]|nr:DUF839 domain-containing protein [Verrucomicrobiae bacterium]
MIFDRQLHTMPWIGRFAWENTLVRPDAGKYTVLMGMEDGPNTTDNQLYMWVGVKDKKAKEPLAKNGMARDCGALYVLVPDNAAEIDESVVTSGSINAHWVVVENAEAYSDTELEVATDALGAFGFVRIEDGAFDKKDANTFYFVTTGSGAVNVLGRLYKLQLNKHNPAGPCKLTIIYNADTIVAGGGDIAISPDNIDTSRDYIMINEDGTSQSRAVMASKGRERPHLASRHQEQLRGDARGRTESPRHHPDHQCGDHCRPARNLQRHPGYRPRRVGDHRHH